MEVEDLHQELTAFFHSRRDIAFALQVVGSGGVLYEFTHGTDASGNAVSGTTLFPGCSTAKIITGLTLLRLVDAGVLSLDVPVTEYIPWLRFPGDTVPNQVTLRHLLSHTSGLSTDPDFPERLFTGEPTALEVHVREDIPTFTVAASPGDVLWYSNAGFSIAGAIAQTIENRPFGDLAEDYVLSPLQMDRTSFVPGALENAPCVEYEGRADRPIPINYPAGGALSCAADFGSLARAILSQANGARHLIARGTFDEMTTVHGDGYCGEPRRYGLACDIEDFRGSTLLSHGGGGFGCGTTFAVWPDADLGVVALFNDPAGYAFGHRRIFERLAPVVQTESRPVENHAAAGLPPSKGTYLSPMSGSDMGPERLHIELNDEQLLVEDGSGTRRFSAREDGIFVSERPGESLGFTPDGGFAMYDAFGIGLVSVTPYRRASALRTP